MINGVEMGEPVRRWLINQKYTSKKNTKGTDLLLTAGK